MDSCTTGMLASGNICRRTDQAPWSRPQSWSACTVVLEISERVASAISGAPCAGYSMLNSSRGKPWKSWIVRGCIIDVTAVPRVSQCAEMQRTAVGTGSSRPSCLHSSVHTFVSMAFIGLPCPIKSTGIRSVFGKLISDVNVASKDK